MTSISVSQFLNFLTGFTICILSPLLIWHCITVEKQIVKVLDVWGFQIYIFLKFTKITILWIFWNFFIDTITPPSQFLKKISLVGTKLYNTEDKRDIYIFKYTLLVNVIYFPDNFFICQRQFLIVNL